MQAAKGLLGRPDLASHSSRQPREERSPRGGPQKRDKPQHGSRLPVERPTYFGGEAVVPAFGLQQEVEVEEIVGRKCRSGRVLAELGRQSPHLHANTARHEQIHDATARILGDSAAAVRAAEAVRAALVVGADANSQVLARELYVSAARAVRSDRGHCVRPSRSLQSRLLAVLLPFGRPTQTLEASGCDAFGTVSPFRTRAVTYRPCP